MSKYGIVIQARISSSRLPGKVLMDINGSPMLCRQVNRLKKFIPSIPIIVATSEDSSDDEIEKMCKKNDISCFRGPLENVILRFIKCSEKYDLDYIIRVGGDDPLIDPDCCKSLISENEKENIDFIYASCKTGWPYGAAAELIKVEALKKINASTDESFYREHTIPYFFDNPESFKIKKLNSPNQIRRPDYFFTVDFPEDLELVRKIFSKLLHIGDYFPFIKVIDLIDKNPHYLEINKKFHSGFDH